METFLIAIIIVFAFSFVKGALGWGIIATAVLYLIFDTVSENIQKSQTKMRKEMDTFLSNSKKASNELAALEASVEEILADDIPEENIVTNEKEENTIEIEAEPAATQDTTETSTATPPQDPAATTQDDLLSALDEHIEENS